MNLFHSFTHRSLKIYLALLAIYLIWGTTYLAVRIAVESLPGFLMIAFRYLISGAVLYGIARCSGKPRPRWEDWKHAAILGISVMGICNGTVALIAHKVPSGIIACIFATGPFVLSIVNWVGIGKSGPSGRQLLSMCAGFSGVVLLTFSGTGMPAERFWPYALLLMLATLSWAIGTAWTQKRETDTSVMMTSSLQMIWGGGLSLVLAIVKGDFVGFASINISGPSLLALAYLVVFGTIIAFVSYNFLLKTTDTPLVAAHAYVNPLVALVAGSLVLGEQMTPSGMLSVLIILLAVYVSLRSTSATGIRKQRRLDRPSGMGWGIGLRLAPKFGGQQIRER